MSKREQALDPTGIHKLVPIAILRQGRAWSKHMLLMTKYHARAWWLSINLIKVMNMALNGAGDMDRIICEILRFFGEAIIAWEMIWLASNRIYLADAMSMESKIMFST